MIGNRIKQLRKEHNLTQNQFASLFGVYDSTISQYENGKREPEYNTVIKIANKFNVSIDWLLGRVESKDLVKLETDNLPEQLRDVGVEYLMLAKEMREKEIPPEDVRKIINAINALKNK
ncbi:MAG TPA: helix-turn-helix transcriptional regulator [Clostridiaceae bacterium]|jgi:transcriptional regulator with XRE-family HTH domain|nr:helix-turn-helix transcriptional regulator [Clostridiaceae bacterium]